MNEVPPKLRLRLPEERERQLTTLDAALMWGLSDVEAGRFTPAETVFDDLEEKYQSMAPK